MIKMLFHQIVGQYRLTYCGCSGDGAGGDAACSSGDGGDGGDSGPSAAQAAAAGTPGGFAVGADGSYSTDVGTFSDAADGGYTFSGRDVSDRFSDIENRRAQVDTHLRDVQDEEWEAADTLSEYASYGMKHHALPTVAGLAFGWPAALAMRAGQQYSQGYSPEAIAANAALGLGSQVISQTVGPAVARSTYDALGSKGLAIAAGKGAAAVGKGMLSEAIESGKYSPTETTADTTLADADSTMADETMASLASAPLPSADDAYASAGFGNIRNRQMRSRVRTPLTRG